MTHTNIPEIKTPKLAQVTPDLNELANLFVDSFPQLSVDDQRLALKLYRLLAQGEPVSSDQLAAALGRSTDSVNQTLIQWPGVFYDKSACINSFLGLSVEKTPHQLMVNGRSVYTWCAWDTLFLPELLNTTAKISSACGATGEVIRLMVSPSGIQTVEPGDVVVSFLIPDEYDLRENVIASFCHFVFFFRSREDGEAWVAEHDGTFLLSPEEAFTVGQKMNAARFNGTLEKQGPRA
jgi:alkylmercury lyase